MWELILAVLWFLLAVVVLAGLGWFVVWVLGQIGIAVPPLVLKIVGLVALILCFIYLVSLVAGGQRLALPRFGDAAPAAAASVLPG